VHSAVIGNDRDEQAHSRTKRPHFFRLIGRAAAYIERFTIASENLGLASAVRLFALLRRQRNEKTLHLARFNRSVHFRGVADKGVMSHFFIPGYRILDTPAQPVRFIVDAGANIGDETIRFRHFHPAATIVALEANPENFQILKKNFSGDPNAVTILKGLWSHECDLKITPNGSNEAFSVSEVPDGTGDIQAVSVDSLLAFHFSNGSRFAEIDILKLDIEGAEYQVFSKNYESWIRKVKVIIVECSDYERPGTVMTIFRALSSLDFRVHICGENLVIIRNDVPWKLQVSPYFD
jgi:FkbM family methyltransferase